MTTDSPLIEAVRALITDEIFKRDGLFPCCTTADAIMERLAPVLRASDAATEELSSFSPRRHSLLDAYHEAVRNLTGET